MFKKLIRLDHNKKKNIWVVKTIQTIFWIPIVTQRFEYSTLALAKAREL